MTQSKAHEFPAITETDSERVQQIITTAAELLPSQGPITAFAFLNPLQGMEHLAFDEAMRLVSQTYGCEPYLEEGQYFSALQHGRITVEELKDVLTEDLAVRADELVGGLAARMDLRLSMLQVSLHSGDARELQWVIAETEALKTFRSQVTRETRELLLAETRHWIMRDLRKLMSSQMQQDDQNSALLCEVLGVDGTELESFLQSTLLALRGWCGMIWQTEVRPDRVHLASPPGTLIEFLAIRLILDRLALQHLSLQALQYSGSLQDLRTFLLRQCGPSLHSTPALNRSLPPSREQSVFAIFQIAQINGWLPKALAELSTDQWQQLLHENQEFSSHERRRIYHAAYERQIARQAMDAVLVRVSRPPQKPLQPKLQVVCCIDAREESFRRHLEEITSDVETFGTAGFFGVPMYYRGAADAHFAALCPIVIKPQHWVTEEVVFSLEASHRARAKMRRVLGNATHSLHMGTRSSLAGALVSTLLGPLATAPLVSRVLFPRLTARMHHTARQFVAPPIVTRLQLERAEHATAGSEGDQIGFTVSDGTEWSGDTGRHPLHWRPA